MLTDLVACAGGASGSNGNGASGGAAGGPPVGAGGGGAAGGPGLPGEVRMSFTVPAPSIAPVPTLGEWALMLLSVALAGLAGKGLRRTRVS
ncbi:IPTL-CTERM sorting domain-containing protein [Ottowia sp.]|uniref:IPTL-CTERM sorting domain-containing protein n=1 Tax=Ottowia sp. TaxID=1898956 RepID=UPI0025F5FE37|nr:IPTL-CTERM sorting domain-containing protein [Ottowia sp.]MBK6745379.1 IPTL-CTERM sorting domain-containing protein [Ottowia sp.]